MADQQEENADLPSGNVLRRKKGFYRRLRNLFAASTGVVPEAQDSFEPIDKLEVAALVRFATERGIDVDPPALAPLIQLLRADGENCEQGETCPGVPHVPQLVLDEKELPAGGGANAHCCAALDQELNDNYRRLCAHTYAKLGVNGRTIRDSALANDHAISYVGVLFLFFFALALGPKLFTGILSNASPIYIYLNPFLELSPFFWGGVGASVFLLKSLSELAAKSQFDTRRVQGIGPRVFLGAAIGYVMVHVLNVADILTIDVGATTIDIGVAGIAFLSGLGVKAIYGVFETLINGIHAWFTPRKGA